MTKSAYIHLVEKSTHQEITLDDVKQALERYVTMTSHTGKQLGWDYAAAAFPYHVHEEEKDGVRWLRLEGTDPHLYRRLILGVGTRRDHEQTRHYIQCILPPDATHGDLAKGNELSRYLAKVFQAELHLFNGRVMYFYPRK
ncbi:hypothetical protein GCM10011571_26220 [Marinithermofilum abyssi]|uniref:DUF1885 family protein n=1 Tax=Marinithermofilum abyssi TaxID=1571185 RepID=A0A8J2VD61_9BACL|nr:DUF1885 family protein [Marinithermofilum abyssi]GGE22916.1 hypothetical protein GCM10011571_26220 [Marinithermofilum abyssi]